MVQSPSWEANWSAASQEIPRISRNPKVHYRTHKRPPPLCILGQPNPVHKPTSHLLEIHPNIIHPSTPRSPQWSPSLRFPQQDTIHPHLLTHTRHMPSPSHSNLTGYILSNTLFTTLLICFIIAFVAEKGSLHKVRIKLFSIWFSFCVLSYATFDDEGTSITYQSVLLMLPVAKCLRWTHAKAGQPFVCLTFACCPYSERASAFGAVHTFRPPWSWFFSQQRWREMISTFL